MLPSPLDMSPLSEQERLAFFGAMFAVAAADDRITETESSQILDSLDLSNLSETGRERALAMSIAPPSLAACLEYFANASPALRHSLLLNLVDVVLADDEILSGEPLAIEQARTALGIPVGKVAEMHDYAFQLRKTAASSLERIRRPLIFPDELT